jgi:hypothetical protein
VLARVPDINDFVSGMRWLLRPDGVITTKFPRLMQLVELNQFDTTYHEHISLLSFITMTKICTAHSLTMFDVEQLPTRDVRLAATLVRQPIRPTGGSTGHSTARPGGKQELRQF